jgi:hypothetical protein
LGGGIGADFPLLLADFVEEPVERLADDVVINVDFLRRAAAEQPAQWRA